MNGVAFSIGPVSVYWYSIFIMIGALIAFFLITVESKRFDIPDNFVENLAFYGLIIGIIGARIYYCIFEHDSFSSFIDVFKIWEGGLAIHGGLIAGLLWVIFYCKKMRVKVLRMLDIIVVGLILSQAIGRWGNFTNQEAFGRLVNYNEVKERVTDYFDEYDYIFADYAYDKIRLKGFFEKNHEKAIMWMRLSAEQGYDDAIKALIIFGDN